jgi:site-specific DNA-methyltransferase (adenine-specific)
MNDMHYKILCDNAVAVLQAGKIDQLIDLTFLDPPFNQQKEYALHNDNLPEAQYWGMMKTICSAVFNLTNEGGAIYFMQREKNTEPVLRCLRETGWELQNLLIWKKKTAAVPVQGRYGKHYQIIAFATKGVKPKTFHRLRISPPLPAHYKQERQGGIYVTDVWEDIREMTSGYFAGPEALRDEKGERFHKQQAPLALLLRIILTSSRVNEVVLDPFAGTGTTSVVALQTHRQSISIEIDPKNAACIQERLENLRPADVIQPLYQSYIHTEDLATIWGKESYKTEPMGVLQTASLFDN